MLANIFHIIFRASQSTTTHATMPGLCLKETSPSPPPRANEFDRTKALLQSMADQLAETYKLSMEDNFFLDVDNKHKKKTLMDEFVFLMCCVKDKITAHACTTPFPIDVFLDVQKNFDAISNVEEIEPKKIKPESSSESQPAKKSVIKSTKDKPKDTADSSKSDGSFKLCGDLINKKILNKLKAAEISTEGMQALITAITEKPAREASVLTLINHLKDHINAMLHFCSKHTPSNDAEAELIYHLPRRYLAGFSELPTETLNAVCAANDISSAGKNKKDKVTLLLKACEL